MEIAARMSLALPTIVDVTKAARKVYGERLRDVQQGQCVEPGERAKRFVSARLTGREGHEIRFCASTHEGAVRLALRTLGDLRGDD